MGIEFKVAAQAAREDDADRDVIEVTFPEPLGVLKAYRPSTAQSEILGSQLRIQPTLTALELARVIFEDRGDDVVEWLTDMLMERRIEQRDLIGGWGENGEGKNEEGLIDGILRQFTGRPTGPSTGSSSSRSAGGRKSTARSRGKGSIQSDSRSTAS